MLFRHEFLAGIAAGRITVAFRRWDRPSVRAGGKLLTPIGQLAITSVEPVSLEAITATAAKRAGFESKSRLLAELARRPKSELYRVEFRLLGDDPRIALREDDRLDESQLRDLRQRLERLDAHSSVGPWTATVLGLIKRRPGVRAADLASAAGHELVVFKRNVRKLKGLGLTESLGTGYRLSPRGTRLIQVIG